jgi:hypothetical protein
MASFMPSEKIVHNTVIRMEGMGKRHFKNSTLIYLIELSHATTAAIL